MNKLLALLIIAVSMFVCDPPLNSGAKFHIKNQTDMKSEHRARRYIHNIAGRKDAHD
ncbi:MAG: hypothetical protein L6V35_03440 [Alistipes putredinis]|nr:MAG: hypothetical protein L6V35_03440 [Alistipes putredinis]